MASRRRNGSRNRAGSGSRPPTWSSIPSDFVATLMAIHVAVVSSMRSGSGWGRKAEWANSVPCRPSNPAIDTNTPIGLAESASTSTATSGVVTAGEVNDR